MKDSFATTSVNLGYDKRSFRASVTAFFGVHFFVALPVLICVFSLASIAVESRELCRSTSSVNVFCIYDLLLVLVCLCVLDHKVFAKTCQQRGFFHREIHGNLRLFFKRITRLGERDDFFGTR
jgi:hypothetical protein